jgi:hypothetical protein
MLGSDASSADLRVCVDWCVAGDQDSGFTQPRQSTHPNLPTTQRHCAQADSLKDIFEF